MDFCAIPSNLIHHHVLPYLRWNDLLQFRRTCKWTNAIVHGYLNVHPELAPEMEINEDDKTFSAFLKMGIPTTKIFINNTSGCQFFENCYEDAASFLDRFEPLVRSLRLDQLSFFILGKERDFLEATKSVLHFRAGKFAGYERGLDRNVAMEALLDQQSYSDEYPQFYGDNVDHYLPGFFQRLKSVQIGNNDHKIFTGWARHYYTEVVETGRSLTSVSLQAIPFDNVGKPINELIENYIRQQASLCFFCLETRIRSGPPETQYEMIDFVSFHGNEEETQAKLEWMWSVRFLNFCLACVEGGVKLRNVGSRWFQARIGREEENLRSPDLGTAVLSLVNLHPYVLTLNMPNLEGIEIQSTARSIAGGNWREIRPEWESLKTLKINVDSNKGRIYDYKSVFYARPPSVIVGPTKDLLNFFFQDIRRIHLTELCLQFNNQNGTVKVPVPSTNEIVSSSPNLKKLTLVKWPGSDATLTTLWEGLPGLEEVSLEECRELGEKGIIGGDETSPAFLKLNKLKKLSLKRLDMMPKITDAIFTNVISHLKLTHLTLTSGAPVNSITLAGLRSLQNGSFSESIERFPFKSWSLAGVSAAEFLKEEAMFRSYNML